MKPNRGRNGSCAPPERPAAAAAASGWLARPCRLSLTFGTLRPLSPWVLVFHPAFTRRPSCWGSKGVALRSAARVCLALKLDAASAVPDRPARRIDVPRRQLQGLRPTTQKERSARLGRSWNARGIGS